MNQIGSNLVLLKTRATPTVAVIIVIVILGWGSQVVGWTDVQRSQPGGRVRSLISAGLAFAIIDIIVFKALGN